MKLPSKKVKDKISSIKAFAFISIFVFAFGLIGSHFSHVVQAVIREELSYVGKVVDTDGTNLTSSDASCIVAGGANDTCDFRVGIYDASSGGTLLWEEVHTDVEIGLNEGIFQLQLGSITSLSDPDLQNFNRNDLYIQIEFDPNGNGDFAEGEVFNPRMTVSAVAYAMNAEHLGGVSSSGFLQYHPGSAQTSGDVTNALLWLNENGTGAPNLIEIEVGGGDVFIVTNGGDMTLGGGDILGLNSINIDIGEANTSGVTFTGDILPSADDSYNVGSSSLRWQNGYFVNTLNVGGALVLSDGFILNSNGNLNLQANNDTDDYVYFDTTSDTTALYWEGVLAYTNDPGIRVNPITGQIEYRDQDSATWIALDSLGNYNQTTRLLPEYEGAIISADGSDNIGYMTSDVEVSGNYRYNFYEWNSSQATIQDYDIYVKWQVPSGFNGFQSGTNDALIVDIATETSSVADNKIDVYLYEDGSATSPTSDLGNVSSAAAAWHTDQEGNAVITFDDSDTILSTLQAGDILIIRIVLSSGNNNYARVGAITLNWKTN